MENYKILTNYLLNLTTLCHIKCNRRVNFHYALYRLHRKGRMATKFTRLQPTCLSCVGCSALAFHKLHSKLKTFPELKSALQQICDDLPRTVINKAINDFHKLQTHARRPVVDILNTRQELYTEIYILTELCLLFQKKSDKLYLLTCYFSSHSKSSC